ncbi:hypothetical protein SDC9_141689 [bioreactor metagenome]|uniref:Uncharacterized protein n=1 Tax=bioreactor metagenome TaxID=1076179 RepID=A0A645E113_9ZZZZ
MYGRHHFAGRVKRLLIDARPGLFQRFAHCPGESAHIQQSKLGGVANTAVVCNGSVIAKDKPTQKQLVFGGGKALRFAQFTVGVYFGNGHFVLGQGAGFVAANHAHSTQRFHGGQPAHNTVHFDHALYPNSQHDRDYGGQPLRHGGNRKADGGKQHFNNVTALH